MLGEMLYPLLSLGTSFPLGSQSENLDSLLRNGSIRVRRARSEVEPSLLRQRQRVASRARQWTPSYRCGDIIWNVELYDITVLRPDTEIQSSSYTATTALWGKSSSFIGRSKYIIIIDRRRERNHYLFARYLPTTPKYRTEYPRFHTGFSFVPMFDHK